ncbi:MAG: hypothetical protein ACE5SW_03535 [Nitrososphaeraceae archaeon]
MLRKPSILLLTVFGAIASLTLNGILVNEGNIIAQPETSEEFANVIEGNDTETILNDTAISNPNNTMLDATGVNIQEDCMTLADGSQYCP